MLWACWGEPVFILATFHLAPLGWSPCSWQGRVNSPSHPLPSECSLLFNSKCKGDGKCGVLLNPAREMRLWICGQLYHRCQTSFWSFPSPFHPFLPFQIYGVLAALVRRFHVLSILNGTLVVWVPLLYWENEFSLGWVVWKGIQKQLL